MARKRSQNFLVRLTEIEKSSLNARAKKQGISLAQYVRCKVFDVPFDTVLTTMGARPPVEARKPKSTQK